MPLAQVRAMSDTLQVPSTVSWWRPTKRPGLSPEWRRGLQVLSLFRRSGGACCIAVRQLSHACPEWLMSTPLAWMRLRSSQRAPLIWCDRSGDSSPGP